MATFAEEIHTFRSKPYPSDDEHLHCSYCDQNEKGNMCPCDACDKYLCSYCAFGPRRNPADMQTGDRDQHTFCVSCIGDIWKRHEQGRHGWADWDRDSLIMIADVVAGTELSITEGLSEYIGVGEQEGCEIFDHLEAPNAVRPTLVRLDEKETFKPVQMRDGRKSKPRGSRPPRSTWNRSWKPWLPTAIARRQLCYKAIVW